MSFAVELCDFVFGLILIEGKSTYKLFDQCAASVESIKDGATA